MDLDHFKNKVAIVTGASSGIGEAIVVALVHKGLKVVGLARRKERLEELSKKLENKDGKFYPLQADVSIEADLINAFKWVKTNVGPIHILINNAGVLRPKGLVDGSPKSWKEILDTNVLGLCIATQLAVKDMQENNVNGHIIHISSVAGHTIPNFPELNVYPASKWAVKALTETLRIELRSLGSKIKITSISPGAVRTELSIASGADHGGEDIFKLIPCLESEDVVNGVIYVLSTPPHVQIHDLIMRPIGENL